MANQLATSKDEVKDLVTKFPGPIILFPSRMQLWILIVLGVGMTIASIFVSVYVYQFRAGIKGAGLGIGMGILGTVFFGLGTVVGVISLQPGSNWLRLNESGFEVTRLFRTKVFRWSEVSNFGIWSLKGGSCVVFKMSNAPINIWDNYNAWLPDTYGLDAGDLVQLMSAWRNLAMNGRVQVD
jgi:hypothetical protein